MRAVFGDALYWVAVSNPHDQWHERAREVTQSLGACRIVTTEEVLTEFLNFLASRGDYLREKAVATVRRIEANQDVEVVAQSHETFQAGLTLYESRRDKEYSLTDCISMQTMRERGLTEVLTHDHHFEQEGFRALLRG
jgi:uncharacterized protein